MSAPTARLPWRSTKNVPTLFTACNRVHARDLSTIPEISQVEVTTTLLSPRASGLAGIAVYTCVDLLGRVDLTAREEAHVPFDPSDVALASLRSATALHLNVKALRPFVRLDVGASGETTTLVYPHVCVANLSIAPKGLVPFEVTALREEISRARFADNQKPDGGFHPALAHDVDLAVSVLK